MIELCEFCDKPALWEDAVYSPDQSLSDPEDPGPDAYVTCQEHHDVLCRNVPSHCEVHSERI